MRLIKVFLYIGLCIDIIGGSILFLMLIANSFLLAVTTAIGFIINIALTLAVLGLLNDFEDLQYSLRRLQEKVRLIEDENRAVQNDITPPPPPASDHTEAAIGTWECVKCGTVNKAGTSFCSNCRAEYSAVLNPTDNPLAKRKKKMSRWIK
ncbi:MAG: zinc finger Ran-binding domain-containing family 2 protein [Clostridia bacterium]|nr:zinc finger Ran-binding domain-containing family 2 protein [Clostridia bacterium]